MEINESLRRASRREIRFVITEFLLLTVRLHLQFKADPKENVASD